MLLAGGATDETIARQLGLSTRTVERRVRAMLDQLGAETRFQAGVQAARRAGSEPYRWACSTSDSASSSRCRPSRASASLTVHGGTTCSRLIVDERQQPARLAGGDQRGHRRGAGPSVVGHQRLAGRRSRTSSSAQKTPSPRTSPITGCRSASSRRPGPITSAPTRAALLDDALVGHRVIVATAAAQASGWPE